MTKSLEERFWSKVDKDGPTMSHMGSNCWVWTGSKTSKGYGRFHYDGKTHRAHRVSLSFHLGRVPQPCALHACDNSSCVRPDHLREGTHSENETESYGRGRKQPTSGERHGKARLNEDDVRNIRRRYAEGESQTSLAQIYRMDPAHLGKIVRRQRWKHV